MSNQSSWVRNVTEADFQQAVIEQSHHKPVVVDFWAPWCGPCRRLGPRLEAAIQQRKGEVLLAKVNVDENPILAQQHGIEGIPAVMGYVKGRVVLHFVGEVHDRALTAFLEKLTPSGPDRLAQQAQQLEASRPDEAEKTYRQILTGEERHVPSLVGLARVLLDRRQDDEAGELLGRATPPGELGPEIDRLRAILALRGLCRGLPDAPTLRGQLQQTPDNAQLRYQLGCVLAAAGRYTEALEELLAAASADLKLAQGQAKEAMVQVFQIVGSPLADEYRRKLTQLLY